MTGGHADQIADRLREANEKSRGVIVRMFSLVGGYDGVRLSPGSYRVSPSSRSAARRKLRDCFSLWSAASFAHHFMNHRTRNGGDSSQRARREAGDPRYPGLRTFHLNSDRRVQINPTILQNKTVLPPSPSLYLSRGHFSLRVIVEFQPAGAA